MEKKIEWNIQWVYLFIILVLKKSMKMLNIIPLNLETNTAHSRWK